MSTCTECTAAANVAAGVGVPRRCSWCGRLHEPASITAPSAEDMEVSRLRALNADLEACHAQRGKSGVPRCGERCLACLRARVAELERQKDAAYSERNQVLALLGRMAAALGWKTGVGYHLISDPTWEKDWRTILFVELPTGQASWHFHDSERHLLRGLPAYAEAWDGHSTPEKYERVRRALLEPGHG